VFSPGRFADRIFNADDRAAELNGGSYSAIPIELRRQVNVEFEAFVRDSIAQRRSFALETTLRSRITFEQARAARLSGFQVIMTYVALDSFASHLERVTQRAPRRPFCERVDLAADSRQQSRESECVPPAGRKRV